MSVCCSRLFIEPLFSGIKKGDYYEPYKRLGDKLNIKYYRDEIKRKEITDDIFLKYLMCRPNMRLHIYNKEQPFLTELADVEYYKHMVLNEKEYGNLILQLKSIRMKFNDINVETGKTHHLHVYFTESRLETYLDLDSDLEYICGTKTFIETTINAKTLLNPLSIKYLKLQNMKKIVTYHSSIKKLNKFLHWMYKNMTLFDMELFIIWSGMVPFMLGIREFSDLDFHYIDNNTAIINKLKEFKQSKLVDMDLDIEKDKIVYSMKLQNDSMKLIGKDRNDLFVDPNLYFYFYGFKINNLLTHFYWRTIRGRPAQIAELIAMSKIINIPVPKPILPEVKYFTIRYKIKKDENRLKKKIDNEFDDDVSEEVSNELVQERLDYYMTQFEYIYFMEELDRLKIEHHPFNIIPINKSTFLDTIKMYLKNKYNMNVSKKEIIGVLESDGLKSISELKQFLLKNKNYYI